MCGSLFSKFENISRPNICELCAQMHVPFRVKRPLLSDSNQNWKVSTKFCRSPQYQISVELIQRYSKYYTQTDRQTLGCQQAHSHNIRRKPTKNFHSLNICQYVYCTREKCFTPSTPDTWQHCSASHSQQPTGPLSWASVHLSQNPLPSILILSSHLRLGLYQNSKYKFSPPF